ncbi:MAG: acireductone synthase [Trichormus sp.]
MSQQYSDQVKVILLDIEGTTTPVDYVFEVLFPFAKAQVESFLQTHLEDEGVKADLERLRQEYESDIALGASVPEWQENSMIAAVAYIHHLIAIDRKSTGLKSLQGKIWEQGYQDGTLRSQVFDDVNRAFVRWRNAGKQIFIFSSGSVQAQKLLFKYTDVGDLTEFLSGYFDTEIGSKKEPDSYRKIAEAIGVVSNHILFISDVTDELQAAQNAGMKTLFSLRPKNRSSDSEGFPLCQDFDKV